MNGRQRREARERRHAREVAGVVAEAVSGAAVIRNQWGCGGTWSLYGSGRSRNLSAAVRTAQDRAEAGMTVAISRHGVVLATVDAAGEVYYLRGHEGRLADCVRNTRTQCVGCGCSIRRSTNWICASCWMGERVD